MGQFDKLITCLPMWWRGFSADAHARRALVGAALEHAGRTRQTRNAPPGRVRAGDGPLWTGPKGASTSLKLPSIDAIFIVAIYYVAIYADDAVQP